MLTVLQIIPELQAGGAERTTIEVAAALVARGDRALVVSEGGRLEADLAAAGGELRRLPVSTKNPIRMWRNRAALLRLIREEGVDVIHARSRAPAWSALWAARAVKRPFVTTYHGVYNARSAAKRWYNSVMARGDVVIANSHYTAAHVLTAYPDAAERVVVIPRGVDTAAHAPAAISPERIAAVRAQWSLAPDDERAIVLLPGRLTRWKGQAVALEAIAQLSSAERAGLVLVMPGDDQGRVAYRATLEEQITALGLSGVALLPGHCSDMPAAYRAAAVVLSTSIEPEAFGRVAAEAQCAERLVIASDHGGARETVDPAIGGWRVPPGDAEALSQALLAFFALDGEARAITQTHVGDRTRRLYAVEALQNATLAVYGRIT